MNILLMLVPISVVLLGIAIWAFAWAVRRGQFDDLDTPALDILADESRPRPAAANAASAEVHRDAAPPDAAAPSAAAARGADAVDDDAG